MQPYRNIVTYHYPGGMSHFQSVKYQDGFGWQNDGGPQPYFRVGHPVLYDYTRDARMWHLGYMQDCVKHTVRDTYLDTAAQFLCTESGWFDIPTPFIRIHSSSGKANLVRIEDVMDQAYLADDLSSRWDLRSIVPSVDILYGLSLREPITKSITITENPFDSQFSIWFLLVDLKEIPKLLKSLLKDNSLRKLANLRKHATLKDLANDHLAVQFGLLPTIQDLRDFVEVIWRWGDKYSKLNDRFTKGFRHHAPKRIVGGSQVTETIHTANLQFGGQVTIRTVCSIQPTGLHATAHYYFVCPELSGFLSRIKQFVDSLGILDPQAIWDVIPFSFIVDWFYSIGPWIHKNLKPQLFPADIVIYDWCESLGREVYIDVYASYSGIDPDSGAASPKTTQIWAGTLRQYARKRQFPSSLTVDTSPIKLSESIVTIKRTLIGTALALQKFNFADLRANGTKADWRLRALKYKLHNHKKHQRKDAKGGWK